MMCLNTSLNTFDNHRQYGVPWWGRYVLADYLGMD